MLKTNFIGLELKNPVIIAAGPWNGDGAKLRDNLISGAGAVITETIVSDPFLNISPRLAYDGSGVQNIRLYSKIQMEKWKEELKIAKSNGGVVIASISAQTPSELTYLAKKLEKYGADALEISLSSPLGEGFEVVASDKEKVYSLVKAVTSNVKIPVMVKLSQNVTNIIEIAKVSKKAGASAVSAINSLRCILGVDIEKGTPRLPSYGGYSGSPIKPVGLACVGVISQGVDIPICGVGGIDNYENAIEYMMMGASTIQIGTSVLLNGKNKISEIVNGIELWFKNKGIRSVNDICGKALNHMKSIDDLLPETMMCKINDNIDCEIGCISCEKICVNRSIKRKENSIEVDDNCIGCGLCIQDCPVYKLALE